VLGLTPDRRIVQFCSDAARDPV